MPTVRAAVLPAPGHAAEVRELPVPALEPDSGLLVIELSEVCGTDVHLRAGRLSGVPYPLVPGHVSVGRLEAIRGTLADVHGRRLREGDAVTFLDVHRTCGACWHCLVAKASTRCPHRKVYGITYGAADGLAGGWADKLYLRPGTRMVPLDGIDPVTFMAGGCSLPTALHGIERGEVRWGDTVLVLGSGPVGLSSIILSRMRGAAAVLCIGAPAGRLATAAQVGAAATLDFTSAGREERLEWVLEHTAGRGADVTIEATGAADAVIDAMRCTRDAGTVVVLGQYTDHGEVPFNPHSDLNRKHLDVRLLGLGLLALPSGRRATARSGARSRVGAGAARALRARGREPCARPRGRGRRDQGTHRSGRVSESTGTESICRKSSPTQRSAVRLDQAPSHRGP